MTSMGAASMISYTDSLSIDAEGTVDFIELSALLGEVFPSNDATYRNDLGNAATVSAADHDPYYSMTEFNFLPPVVITHESDSATSSYIGQEKEFIHPHSMEHVRVSPTPSTATLAVDCDNTSHSLRKKNVVNVPNQRQGSRKRKVRNDSDPSVVIDTSSNQKIRRRERNREHAKRSRSKKKDFTKQLEESVEMLREENEKLKDLVCKKLGKSKEHTDEAIKERIVIPANRFIASLKKPSNRILSNSTILYLKMLGKDFSER